ncbi:hypothetical protein ACFL4C_00075 [Candidatus Omnitrophota bacterium]
MKDKKTLILFVFSVSVIIILLFISRPVSERIRQTRIDTGTQGFAMGDLKTENAKSKDLIKSFTRINYHLKKNLDTKERELLREKERSENLQAELEKTSFKSEALSKELSQVKANLSGLQELTQPIKRRFEGLENTFEGIRSSLSALGFSPAKEKELKKQFKILRKELDSIDRQIPLLIKQNNSYQAQARTLEELLAEKDSKIQQLGQELNETLAEFGEQENLIEEKEILEKRLRESRKRNELFEKELEGGRTEIVSLQGRLEQELAKKTKELNMLAQAKAGMEKQVVKFQEENALLEEELA